MNRIPTTRFARLQHLLEGSEITAPKTTYHCCHVDELALVFSESDGTKKVMIPTDVALEWISALEFGFIDDSMDARAMREKIKDCSEWAPFQHGFETHLRAIVVAWHGAFPKG